MHSYSKDSFEGVVLEILKRLEDLMVQKEVKPMNIMEAAKYMGVSKGHLYKLTCKNVVPFYKPNGKQIYFKKSELDGWIYKRRSTPKNEVRANV